VNILPVFNVTVVDLWLIVWRLIDLISARQL
jgi:hypothetical protein